MTREDDLRAMREAQFGSSSPAGAQGRKGAGNVAPKAQGTAVLQEMLRSGELQRGLNTERRRGRPLEALRGEAYSATRPWEKEVPPMSRATWYRRRRPKP